MTQFNLTKDMYRYQDDLVSHSRHWEAIDLLEKSSDDKDKIMTIGIIPVIHAGLRNEENDIAIFLPKCHGICYLEGNLSRVFLSLIYIIIFVVGLPTNAVSLWVLLFRTKKKMRPSSILLANLALADLLFIVWLPLKIAYHLNGNDWIFGEPLCKVLVGFFYGNMYCSAIFIACISVQRYWAIAHPLSQKLNTRVTACMCACVWIVVWLISIPLYLHDQTVKITEPDITTCHDIIYPHQLHLSIGYFVTMGIVGYVVPCVVCTVAYLLTLRSLKLSMKTSVSKEKKKATVLMIIVLVMFLVCFTPSNILLMVHYSLLALKIDNYAHAFYVVTLCLSGLNSCLDPFVYYFISKEFRDHVKNTLKCCRARSGL